MITEEEFKKAVKQYCNQKGAYETTKLVSQVFNESAAEYSALGNHEAIIHVDAQHLEHALFAMANSHPLRRLR